jgi:hypothetical protein
MARAEERREGERREGERREGEDQHLEPILGFRFEPSLV